VGPPLEVITPQGDTIPITPKSVFDPHKTLGHLQSPAGTAKTQLKKTSITQSTLSQQLTSSPATRSQATTYYHTIYLPSIYVLPQTFFTAKELDNAKNKSMPVIFAKEEFNRNTTRDLLYGPSDYAGGGHFRWKWLQGEGQIMNFLKFWRTDGQVSTMLRIAVSWYQQHAGVSFSLFDDVHTPIPYASARWLHLLRTFLATVNGQLELDTTYVPTPQRHHDTHLMDLVVTPNAFTPEIQAVLNYCRLSLNVITVSDISNAAGTHLIPGVEWGELEHFPSTSTDHQTNQPSPAVFYWKYWQRLLHIIAHPDGTLRTPLGPWMHDGSDLRRTWNAYFDMRYNFLFRNTSVGWIQYELLIHDSLTAYTVNGILPCLPFLFPLKNSPKTAGDSPTLLPFFITQPP
jgi:hypothetical protein